MILKAFWVILTNVLEYAIISSACGNFSLAKRGFIYEKEIDKKKLKEGGPV